MDRSRICGTDPENLQAFTRDQSQNVLRLHGIDPGNFHHIVHKSFVLTYEKFLAIPLG